MKQFSYIFLHLPAKHTRLLVQYLPQKTKQREAQIPQQRTLQCLPECPGLLEAIWNQEGKISISNGHSTSYQISIIFSLTSTLHQERSLYQTVSVAYHIAYFFFNFFIFYLCPKPKVTFFILPPSSCTKKKLRGHWVKKIQRHGQWFSFHS